MAIGCKRQLYWWWRLLIAVEEQEQGLYYRGGGVPLDAHEDAASDGMREQGGEDKRVGSATERAMQKVVGGRTSRRKGNVAHCQEEKCG